MKSVSGSEDKRGRGGPVLVPLVLVALLLGLVAAGRVFGLGDKLALLREWIATLGCLGPFVYTGIYVLAVVVAVPGAAITALAGALFGSVLGVVVVSVGSTLGAGLCFLIARFVARKAITRRFAGNAHFQKLERMTQRHGALMVAVTRLVPLFPFNILNYGFGLTGIGFGTYLIWSWICMLPGTVLYVVGADTLTRSMAEGRVPVVLLVILALVGAGIALLARTARRKIADENYEGDEEARDHEG